MKLTMSRARTRRIMAFMAIVSGTCSPAVAASSTAAGRISVAQVMQMLNEASSNRTAQQVLTAYLGGVGETAGLLAQANGRSCSRPLSLSDASARQAIEAELRGRDPTTVAATPLIVGHMFTRAGCRR